MTEPYGIDVLVSFIYGSAGGLSQGETADFLSIMPIYTILNYRSAQCAHTDSDEKSNFLQQSPSNIRLECGWLNMRSRRQRLKQGLKEDKMEWVITLIVVMIVPFWIILWWIPHCDAIGIQKAK
jgi:hypothetical protein